MKLTVCSGGVCHADTKNSLSTQIFTDFELLELPLNEALVKSQGEYFTVVHPGDILEPDYLKKVVGKLDSDPVYGMVSTHGVLIDKDGKETNNPAIESLLVATNRSQSEWIDNLYSGNWFRGTVTFRKSLNLGNFMELKHFAELEYIIRILHKAPIWIIQEKLEKIVEKDIEGHYDFVHDLGVIQRKYYRKHTAESLKGKIKLIIATPFYEVKGFSPYIKALWDTQRLLLKEGIDHDFWPHDGDSYVDRARNTICAKFLESDATHLLLIDSDENWDCEAIPKMIAADKEVIGGAYPMKNNWNMWSCIPTMRNGRIVGETDKQVGLPEAQVVSAGFMLIKRSALEKFEKHYPDLCYAETSADGNKKSRIYTAFFECCRIRGVRKGEDSSFSLRMIEMGEKLFIYPDINFGHFGIHGWYGNYDKFLRGETYP